MNALAILSLAEQLVTIASQLVPAVEQDIADARKGLSTLDPVSAQKQIAALHVRSQALTAQLDALKSA